MKVPKARKLPSGTWFLQLRLGGESVTVNAHTERECVRQAQIIKSEYLAGKKPLQLQSGPSRTLRQAIDVYIATRILSPSTERGYIKIRDLRFRELMDRPLVDITPEDYQAACKREARSVSAKTLRNAWSFVASVLRHNGITPPAVSLPQLIPHQTPFLDHDEIQAFVEVVKGTKYQIPIYLALSSLRRSEIMGLRWECVDLKRRRIRVAGAAVVGKDEQLHHKQENKNTASNRYVPILMDELYEALKEARQSEGLVVTCNPNTIWANVRRICKRAGLPMVGTHGLRHSFASLAYYLEVPEKVTMEIGGWADDQTMRRIYTHIAQADVKRYEQAFSGFFANKNANKK
ncbi:MAG: site-specific integrase [Oscillospiraceae bacterium]|nr:site-specific integrase [Oscillospiraceae bacterium]